VVIAVLRAIESESAVAVVAWPAVQGLKYLLRYGPMAAATVVAILAKDQTKSRAQRALQALEVLRGHNSAGHAKALAAGELPRPSESGGQ
jgi:hypothetical protein